MTSRIVGLGPNLRRSILAPRPVFRGGVIRRTVHLESRPAADVTNVLNAQRLKRPSSPHFTIYQPQITWIASIANRVTGVGLSVLLYGFSLAYLAGPVVGMPFDSAAVIDVVHELPESIKLAGKAILAAPFAFHGLNGIRHLSWDMTKIMSNRAVARSGYLVIGGTVISTVALLML